MRHIKKGPEPEPFSQWKDNNRALTVMWEDLATDAKQSLRDALLSEQSHICCYCGKRIKRSNGEIEANSDEKEEKGIVIEHLKPRSAFAAQTFDYTNLLASCLGGEKDTPPRVLHCDKKKDNWYDDELMVSPLNPDCENYFIFRADGRIEGTDDPAMKRAALETIQRLGLDVGSLIAQREKALEPIVEVLESTSDAEKLALIEGYSEADRDGRLAPFCFALVQILKRYL